MSLKNRKEQRVARHLRIRRRIGGGTPERPRMAIFVSNRYMYVQFIDDEAGNTLASASTLKGGWKCNLEGAKALGEAAAQAAQAKGIKTVIVDRAGYKYHGRVKTIVETAVAAGLSITSKTTAKTEEA